MVQQYDPTNWINETTRVNADNMNHIEQGIKNIVDDMTPVEEKVVGIEEGATNNKITFVRWS